MKGALREGPAATACDRWMPRDTHMPYPSTVTRPIGDSDLADRWHLADGDALERRSGRTFTFSDGARCVIIELGTVDGRWAATGIDVRSYGPRAKGTVSPLTVRQLRALPLGDLIRRAGVELGEVLSGVIEKEGGGEVVRDHLGRHRVSIAGAGAKLGLEKLQAPPRRSKRIPRALLDNAARIYQAADLPAGHPTKAVADEMKIPRSTASKWVRRCRDLGLI